MATKNVYSYLGNYTCSELRKMLIDMDLPVPKNKSEMIAVITKAFKEYEDHKKTKIDQYKVLHKYDTYTHQSNIYLVSSNSDCQYIMKAFPSSKTSESIYKEVELQKIASDAGIAPVIVDFDTVSKYIVMEKLDRNLLDDIKLQGYTVNKNQQKSIYNIHKKLDELGIFYSNIDIRNYMYKADQLYIIDFSEAKDITKKLLRKLDTDKPNIQNISNKIPKILQELGCPESSYYYICKYT